MTAGPQSVWLVEDHDPYRRAMAAVLAAAGYACTGQFVSCEAAEAAARRGSPPPAAVLLDLELPGAGGVAGLPRLRALLPAARVVVLTAFDDDDRIWAALAAGADGYLLKAAPPADVVRGVADALAGGAAINARIARRLLAYFPATARPTPADPGLSDREREVLAALVAGRSKKQIAAGFGLSVHTVDTYVRRVYEKLRVSSRSAAVSRAVRDRLV